VQLRQFYLGATASSSLASAICSNRSKGNRFVRVSRTGGDLFLNTAKRSIRLCRGISLADLPTYAIGAA
jgi:hypothetical protein